MWMWIPYLYAQMGVPLFVMISGALLLAKEDSLLYFFQKRVVAVLVPWVGWTGVYVLIDYFFHSVHPQSLHNWIKFVYEMFFSRFWFLPMIFGVYLLSPLLKVLVRNATRQIMIYALVLWYVALSILPALYKVFGIYNSLDSSLLRQVIQYSGLFVLGYLLARKGIVKRPLRFWVTVFLISLAGTYLAVFLDSFATIGAYTDPFFYRIFSPTMVPGVVAFFMVLFLKSQKWEKVWTERTKRIITSMSEAALGIYLVHEIVQEVITKQFAFIDRFLASIYPIFSVPLRALLLFMLSYLIIRLLRKFSFTRIFT
jgi:surface polysaccharide O-acyltransferase-like enzyme